MTGAAVLFDSVTVWYDGAPEPAVSGVDLEIPEGELVLVVGQTGSGKSTLLRCVNGLVPHFTGGQLSGRVLVAGRDTRTNPPRELADVVGMVGQDPVSGFVAEIVEDELAYGMECLGLPPDVMRRRVEETLDLLGLADLRGRPLATLSGGERQRVAIGAALTAHPQILVLDEPTSALDPGAAEEVLAALQRLVHDLGMTVILAEHRLERVVQYADRVVVVEQQQIRSGSPSAMMVTSPVAPPVVELGRLAGWQPLPLSVRDARRAAGPLRHRLSLAADSATADPSTATGPSLGQAATGLGVRGDGPADPGSQRPAAGHSDAPSSASIRRWRGRSRREGATQSSDAGVRQEGAGPAIKVTGLSVGYGAPVLQGVNIAIQPGESVALMGRNGAGKSTLLAALAGMRPAQAGTVRVRGLDPVGLAGRGLVSTLGYVPQDPADLLYTTTVERECADADRMVGAPAGSAAAILAELAPGIPAEVHPRELSEGQRLALALAVVLTGEPPILLLDEPTRGLDYEAKRRLVRMLARLCNLRVATLMATHDVELVAEVASRVIILADGQLVADGPTQDVVVGSPLFAPQVAKILHPVPWLTVGQVRLALAAS